jgi:hypothetical protein
MGSGIPWDFDFSSSLDGISLRRGRKMEKTVPWRSDDWLLRTRIRPLWRAMIWLLTQSPRPVPVDPLVV